MSILKDLLQVSIFYVEKAISLSRIWIKDYVPSVIKDTALDICDKCSEAALLT